MGSGGERVERREWRDVEGNEVGEWPWDVEHHVDLASLNLRRMQDSCGEKNAVGCGKLMRASYPSCSEKFPGFYNNSDCCGSEVTLENLISSSDAFCLSLAGCQSAP